MWCAGRGPSSTAWLAWLVAAIALLVGAPAAGAATTWDGSARVAWEKSLGSRVVSTADPSVVVGATADLHGTTVEAADGADGHRLWKVRLPGLASARYMEDDGVSLAAGHGVVALATRAGVQVLELGTGRLLWSDPPASTRGDEGTDPVVAVDADTVLVSSPASPGAVLISYDRTTGAERWRSRSRSGMTVAGDSVVAGDRCAWDVLSKATGAVRWSVPRPDGYCSDSRPLVVDDGLLVDPRGDRPVLRRLADGGPVSTLQSADRPSVVGATDGVFVAERTDDVAAFDRTGAVLWTRPRAASPGYRDTFLHDGQLVEVEPDPRGSYATAYATTVRVLDPADGRVLASVVPGDGQRAVAAGDGPLALFNGLTSVVVPGVGGAVVGDQYGPDGSGPRLYGTPSVTAGRTVRVPVRTPAGEQAQCRLDDGAWQACASGWTSPDLGTEGEHAIEVRSTGRPAMRRFVEVDRTGPTVTLLRRPDPLVSWYVGDDLTRFGADEAGVRFECREDDASWASCEGEYRPPYRRTSGTHRIDVRGTDPAGNVGPVASATWREDRDAPRVSIDEQAGRVDGYETTFTFSATDEQGPVTTRCTLTSGYRSDLPKDVPCTSPFRVEVPGPGRYGLEVVATDEGESTGRASSGASFLALRDITPVVVVTRRASNGSGTTTDYWGESVWVSDWRRGIYGIDLRTSCRFTRLGVPASGPWADCAQQTFTPGGGFLPNREGRYVLQVRTTDDLDRSGPISEYGFGLDRLGPVARLVGGQVENAPAGSMVQLPTLEVDEPTEDQAPISGQRCTVRDGSGTGFTAQCGDTVRMPEGYGIVVEATVGDAAYNTTTVTRVIRTIAPPPTTTTTPTTTTAPVGPTTTTAPTSTTPTGAAPPATGAATTTATRPTTPPVPRPSPSRGTTSTPTATAPAAPPCRASRARGARPPVVRSVVRRSGRVVATVRVPGASRRRPVRLVLEGRSGCAGRWSALRRATARSGSVVVRGSRSSTVLSEVRVRSSRGGTAATSGSRAIR